MLELLFEILLRGFGWVVHPVPCDLCDAVVVSEYDGYVIRFRYVCFDRRERPEVVAAGLEKLKRGEGAA